MKAITKASRVNSAIQVIQRMNHGMTVIAACNEIGIPRSTFYDIVKKNPEVIAEYQEIIEANARQQLGLILFHKTEILHRVIEDGLSDNTTPRDRLAIYKTLSELEGELNHTLQIESQAAANAHEFLKQGPVIRPQISRFTATQSTIMIESET